MTCAAKENWGEITAAITRNKMATSLENANPTIFQAKQERAILPEEEDDDVVDKIDEREVFDILFEQCCVEIGLVTPRFNMGLVLLGHYTEKIID